MNLLDTASRILWRQRGGIQPDSNKESALRSRLMPVPLPEKLMLPLAQGNQAPAQVLVKPGQQVLKYQILARAVGDNSINLHAPTSGEIGRLMDSPGLAEFQPACKQLELTPDGLDQALSLAGSSQWQDCSREEIIKTLAKAGICGMGGAGFPLAAKLKAAQQHGIPTLIINAAECEPFISADQALLRERAREVLQGAAILKLATGATRCVIAIESDKSDALTALRACEMDEPIDIVRLRSAYPAGNEKKLVYSVTGIQVPTGSIPPRHGVFVSNAGTVYACKRAVIDGEPCISRITTLSGGALLTPKNFEAAIGTPLQHLLTLCGVDDSKLDRVIIGGSLMGHQVSDLSAPVDKTCNSIIAATSQELPEPGKEEPCIRCGFCVNACPVQLLPQQLYSFSRARQWPELEQHGLADCVECGACSYVCPSQIPLSRYFRAAKWELNQQLLSRESSELWQERFQFLQYRRMKTRQEKTAGREKRRINKGASTSGTSNSFSREKAQQDIAAAVARVKARRANAAQAETPDQGD